MIAPFWIFVATCFIATAIASFWVMWIILKWTKEEQMIDAEAQEKEVLYNYEERT